MATKMSVPELIQSFYPYLRSAMVRFPLCKKYFFLLLFLWRKSITHLIYNLIINDTVCRTTPAETDLIIDMLIGSWCEMIPLTFLGVRNLEGGFGLTSPSFVKCFQFFF